MKEPDARPCAMPYIRTLNVGSIERSQSAKGREYAVDILASYIREQITVMQHGILPNIFYIVRFGDWKITQWAH
jgi:hypothetical protein